VRGGFEPPTPFKSCHSTSLQGVEKRNEIIDLRQREPDHLSTLDGRELTTFKQCAMPRPATLRRREALAERAGTAVVHVGGSGAKTLKTRSDKCAARADVEEALLTLAIVAGRAAEVDVERVSARHRGHVRGRGWRGRTRRAQTLEPRVEPGGLRVRHLRRSRHALVHPLVHQVAEGRNVATPVKGCLMGERLPKVLSAPRADVVRRPRGPAADGSEGPRPPIVAAFEVTRGAGHGHRTPGVKGLSYHFSGSTACS